MKNTSSRGVPAALLATVLCTAGSLVPAPGPGALAAAQTYGFSTGSSPFESVPIGVFAAGDSITGTFTYDPATPAFGNGADGSTVYRSTAGIAVVGGLTALVQGVTIADPRGSAVSVGHNLAQVGGSPGPLDILQLSFEPPLGTGTHNVSAPPFGGYSLVNIRMFWLQGANGIPAFLSDQTLPGALPTLQGRLALDFIPVGTSFAQPTASVFFDGLQVAAVPEPETHALMLAGLAVCLQVAARRLPTPSAPD